MLKIYKRYEYKDHLGNVRVVSNDIKSRAVSTVPFTTKIYNWELLPIRNAADRDGRQL